MQAKVVDIESPEIQDFYNYKPEDPEVFAFLLQISVTAENLQGEEIFDVQVCTPLWLLSKYNKDEVIIGRHLLIVFEYNFSRIKKRIVSYIESCFGETWTEVAQKVGRIGYWEFEDYIE